MDIDLWDDDLPDGFIQECEEIETQATLSQSVAVPQPQTVRSLEQPRPLASRSTASSSSGFGSRPLSGLDKLQNAPITSISLSSSSSSSGPRSGSSSVTLSASQRKLKTPVKSLPAICSQSRNPASAQIEWLRSQLDKEKARIAELENAQLVLQGENHVLRDRYNCSVNESLKNLQRVEDDATKKITEAKDENKELKKQLDNLKMQLLLKSKEAAANMDRHKELRNVSLLEPEVSHSSRSQFSKRGWKRSPRVDPNVIEILSDDEEDQKDLLRFLARGARPSGPSLPREPKPGSSTDEVRPAEEPVRLSRDQRTLKALWRLQRKSPWLGSCDSPEGDFAVDCGQLLARRVGDKLTHPASPEIGVIITPLIDYDPRNVLKMDSSDLKYLKNLEQGLSVWGVNLKTMYSNVPAEGENDIDDGNQALETIKTLLGSQVSHYREESNDADMLPSCSRAVEMKPLSGKDPMMLPTLEPVSTHINALMKLSSWRQARDMIRTIVLHITGMVNELFLRLCDPNIANQLKDEFHKKEEEVSRLYMEGPYSVGDTLHHMKWTKEERFVDLRRGLALLALICCLDRHTANLLLQPRLLEEVQSAVSQVESKVEVNLDDPWIHARTKAKIISKTEAVASRLRGKRSGASSAVTQSPSSASKDWMLQQVASLTVTPNRGKESSGDANSSSTVDLEEVMDVDTGSRSNPTVGNQLSAPADQSDSFKIWYDFYADKSKKSINLQHISDVKLHKFIRLVDPNLEEKERRQLGQYLQRSNRFKEFYKAVTEEGKLWVPSDQGESSFGNGTSVKNLFDYENRISPLDTTICTQEFNRMKPVETSEWPRPSYEMEVDEERTPRSSESGSGALVLKNAENCENSPLKEIISSGKDAADKPTSFFDRLKSMKGFKMPMRNDFERVPTLKDGTEEEFIKVLSTFNNTKMGPPKMVGRKMLAPLKKPLKTGFVGPSSSGGCFSSIREEVEQEIDKLYDRDDCNRNFKSFKKSNVAGSRNLQIVKSVFSPYVLPISASNFEEHFFNLYKKLEYVATKLKLKDRLKPFESLLFVKMLRREHRLEIPLQPRNALEYPHPGSSRSKPIQICEVNERGADLEEDRTSEDILNMLTNEAKKYNLKEHMKSYEEKKSKLHILEGLLEIVTCINYCRLTLTFYPLLASVVELIESIFMHSLHNSCFTVESLKLSMRILNEVVCCQPPPQVIGKILSIMIFSTVFPEIVDCLCKNRSQLASLVSGNEFCFFKGVCMMQPLCFLAGLESRAGRGSWEVGAAFVRWLRLLHGRCATHLARWYNSGNCRCIPVQNAALFSTLAAAAARYADQGTSLENEQRKAVEATLRDGVVLCRTLIAVDSAFTTHVPDFDLYSKFIHCVKLFHDDSQYPTFCLTQYELNIIDYLIRAEKRSHNLSEDSTASTRSVTPPPTFDFKDVLSEDHIFLMREQIYCSNLR